MPREPGSRRLMWVLLVMAILLALVFAGSVAWRSPGDYLPWIDGGAYTGVILLAALIAVLRAGRGGPQGPGWGLLATGMILYALGEVWWAVAGRFREEIVWLPLEDALWLAYYPVQVLVAADGQGPPT